MKRKEKPTGVESLAVVRNFRQVIEKRDIHLMKKELYEFLNLYCGFIAHNNIHGFKAEYAGSNGFSKVFISHFDKDHRYFCRIYPCDTKPYKESGFTVAHIKGEFCRVVERHKTAIRSWGEEKRRQERYQVYLSLKKEFEPEESIQCGMNPAPTS